MKTKKQILALMAMMVLIFLLTACASEKDKNTAKLVLQQIEQIGDVTLEKVNII